MSIEVEPQITFDVETKLLSLHKHPDTPEPRNLEKIEAYLQSVEDGLIVFDMEKLVAEYAHHDQASAYHMAILDGVISSSAAHLFEESDPVFATLMGFDIYPHLQRFLNQGGVTGDVLRDMEVGINLVRSAVGMKKVDRLGSRVGIKEIGVEVTRWIERGEQTVQQSGVTQWLSPSLVINPVACDCYGVDGGSATVYQHSDESPGLLYSLTPHNVDAPWQKVSHVMAMGALAKAAFEAEVMGDLFDSVEWGPELIY